MEVKHTSDMEKHRRISDREANIRSEQRPVTYSEDLECLIEEMLTDLVLRELLIYLKKQIQLVHRVNSICIRTSRSARAVPS